MLLLVTKVLLECFRVTKYLPAVAAKGESKGRKKSNLQRSMLVSVLMIEHSGIPIVSKDVMF